MARRKPAAPPERPRRGTPAETRRRLIEAAARVFNEDGYERTDSNQLAAAAGYAPGTFYKHFADKREIFLAVYATWVAAEWTAIEKRIALGGRLHELAAEVIRITHDFHVRWQGFRASLRALVVWDDKVRAFQRRERRRQLRTLARLRQGGRTSEEDALLLFTLERALDAIADGEAQSLGLRVKPILELLEQRVVAYMRGGAG